MEGRVITELPCCISFDVERDGDPDGAELILAVAGAMAEAIASAAALVPSSGLNWMTKKQSMRVTMSE
jgi:hypothetical protein